MNVGTRKPVDLFSEGTRLAAEIFTPGDKSPKSEFPTILLCHGWGGLKGHLARYAEKFAAAGYLCMTFDYRGWGESDGRIISADRNERLLSAEERTLQVRVLREIVDPIDQVADIKACLAYLTSEPQVDKTRLGLWGTSYGGGHAAFMTGWDNRIRCAVVQIGGFDFPSQYRDQARARAADKARGTLNPIVPQKGLDGVSGLEGTPDIARQAEHSQLSGAARIKVPTLFIDAEHEELHNRLEHGWAAYLMARQQAVAEYRTIPGKHYDAYEQFYDETTDAAVEWFKKYL